MSKKYKSLPASKASTEWMDICRNLDKNYKLPELRDIARKALRIDTSRYKKRELCMLLAVQFTKAKFPVAKKHKSGCRNDDSLLLSEPFDEAAPGSYIKDQSGYCFFPWEILEFINKGMPHPYHRQPWDAVKTFNRQKTLKQAAFEPIPFNVEAIHRELPRGLSYHQLQTLNDLLAQLRTVETRTRENGNYYYHVDRTRHNEIDINPMSFFVHHELAKEHLRESPIIRRLKLEKYFKPGGTLQNFYNNLLKALREIRVNKFDDLQKLKAAIIISFDVEEDDDDTPYGSPRHGDLFTPDMLRYPSSDRDMRTPSDFTVTESEMEYYEGLQALAEAQMDF